MKSKLLIGLSIIFLMGLLSCNKSNYLSGYTEATFTGLDLTMRPCSGGYFLKVNNKTYRSWDIISNTILNEQTIFPKNYLIQFELPTGGCYDENDNTIKIKITDIKNS